MRLSTFELRDGEPAHAVAAASQTVELCRSIEPMMHVRALGLLATALVQAGDVAAALAAARELLERAAPLRKRFDCRLAVCVLATLQEDGEDPALRAKLLGYANFDELESTGRNLLRTWKVLLELRSVAVAKIRAQLDAQTFEDCTLEGAGWDEETAYRESLKL